jgi:hypothetical protein
MALIWRIVDAGEFTCPCGAVYRKTFQRLPTRDSNSAICSVCGHEMDRWNSTRVPDYELKRRPEGRVSE